MTPHSDSEDRVASADITLRGDNFEMQARVTVPVGPTRPGQLLPLARLLADAVVQETCNAVAAAGRTISCTQGCGACCNNLVAISEIEARRIGEVVSNLPGPRGAEIRARFAEARQRLHSAGLLDTLQDAEHWTGDGYQQLADSYFRHGITCPFLEAGSCSIYAERPITCREYLVTSPAALCAQPGSAGVQLVRLPLRVFNAVARWQTPPAEHLMERVVPLIIAPEWAATHADNAAAQPGMDLVRELLDHLNERAA